MKKHQLIKTKPNQQEIKRSFRKRPEKLSDVLLFLIILQIISIIPIFIYILIPLFFLLIYILMGIKMKKELNSGAPLLEWFLVFVNYGGLLLFTLTTLYWVWSGLASAGTFYLVTGAPLVMGIIAYRQCKKRKASVYYRSLFYLALSYFVIAPLVIIILAWTE